MKKLFFQHKKHSEIEFKLLWENCIFVFDSNVLLNFYRYSEETSNELKESILYYGDRIWIPNQVGIEFFKNRLRVINEQIKNYDEPLKNLKQLKDSLLRKKGHPFVEKSILDDFLTMSDKIELQFSNQKETLSRVVVDDKVVETIFSLFDSKVGNPYDLKELDKLYIEGSERFKNKIPPGFKDSGKSGTDMFGDYIIWRQMQDKSIEIKKPVVFISDDEKEDWFEINNNKKLGPLPSLILEFKLNTGQDFYLYQTSKFLQYTYSFRDVKVSQPVIDEVKEIALLQTENYNEQLYNFKSISCTIKFNNYAKENINQFYSKLSGYDLSVNEITDQIHHIKLKVPFEDMVRRFRSLLDLLIIDCNLELLSFEYNDSDIAKQLGLFS